MATIGIVDKRPDGAFAGELKMKSYGGKVLFRPIAKRSAAAPDFRVLGQGERGVFEMGAAWIKDRRDGSGSYVSVKLDWPELRAPVYATLGVLAGQDDPDVHAVIWSRPAEQTTGRDPFAALAAA
jgi:uncharacterized protein (DUF736 family)